MFARTRFLRLGIAALAAVVWLGGASRSALADYRDTGYWMDQLRFARDDDDRERAAKELGRLGDPAALPALEAAALYDREDDVRDAARDAILKIRKGATAAYAGLTYHTPLAPPTYAVAPPTYTAAPPAYTVAPPGYTAAPPVIISQPIVVYSPPPPPPVMITRPIVTYSPPVIISRPIAPPRPPVAVHPLPHPPRPRSSFGLNFIFSWSRHR